MATEDLTNEDDEEIDDLPESEIKEDPLFGVTLERTENGVVYQATVESIYVGQRSGLRLYRIRYNDGDLQDLNYSDLLANTKLIKIKSDPSSGDDGNLVTDFKQLWISGSMSDVTIKVQDESIQAHKVVLGARSPVFRCMFAASMTEAACGVVQIEQMNPAAIRNLCEFIYTGTIEDIMLWEDHDSLKDLLHAALKYEVAALISRCVAAAEAQLTVSNVVAWLQLASDAQAHTQKLKFRCIQYILQHMAEVQCTAGWSSLMQDKHLLPEVAPILFQGLCPPCRPSRKRKLNEQS